MKLQKLNSAFKNQHGKVYFKVKAKYKPFFSVFKKNQHISVTYNCNNYFATINPHAE